MKAISVILLSASMALTACQFNKSDQQTTSQEPAQTEENVVVQPEEMTIPLEKLISEPLAIGFNLPESGQIEHAGLMLDLESYFDARYEEGEEYYVPVVDVSFDDERLMRLEGLAEGPEESHEQGPIELIFVSSSKVVGPMGLHIGSTVEDFLAKEPNTNIYYTYVSDRLWLELPGYANYQFLVSTGDCDPAVIENIKGDLTVVKASDLNPQSEVYAIRIFNLE